MAKRYSFEWHNDQCVRKQEKLDAVTGQKRFFCVTHNQWAEELPMAKVTVFTYGDGATHVDTVYYVNSLTLLKIWGRVYVIGVILQIY